MKNIGDEDCTSKSRKRQGYSCPYCPYSNRRPAHLKNHIRIHTGERPYACALCDYKCIQKQNLKSHVFSKHHQ